MGRIVIFRKGIMNENIIYSNVKEYEIDYDYSDDSLKVEITTNRHKRTWIFRKDHIEGILYRENKHEKELDQ